MLFEFDSNMGIHSVLRVPHPYPKLYQAPLPNMQLQFGLKMFRATIKY